MPPRAPELRGTPVPARLPDTSLPASHRQIVFRWDFAQHGFHARGEGVARVAPPDSVRLDFFADGGNAAGFAIVLGNDVFTPESDEARRYLPPAPMLWSALGRLAVPAAPDTTARVDGTVLRADIGKDPTWRATFDGGGLRRLERISGGRVRELVAFDTSGSVRYRHSGDGRTLTLQISKTTDVAAFDSSIWSR